MCALDWVCGAVCRFSDVEFVLAELLDISSFVVCELHPSFEEGRATTDPAHAEAAPTIGTCSLL